jgi:hypothetical protein
MIHQDIPDYISKRNLLGFIMGVNWVILLLSIDWFFLCKKISLNCMQN